MALLWWRAELLKERKKYMNGFRRSEYPLEHITGICTVQQKLDDTKNLPSKFNLGKQIVICVNILYMYPSFL